MWDMTPRETLALIGWSCLAITALIIVFSVTKSPYEMVEGVVNWVKGLRLKKSKKVDPRHRLIEEGWSGSDSEDDPQVAADQGDDSARTDDAKEAA